ncbi:PD40 domain-containing protein [Candidatus Acetothermia bacterium]|nr:PD40 domain-containing protein [Candidatus Acetothermia bacterium]MBI3642731.1 PD40 domain-containing protein [Candidatus Acetothermia bacterium]
MILEVWKRLLDLLTRRYVYPVLLLGLSIVLVGCPAFVNQAPISIVEATPQQGEAPLNVQFDGSHSFDADGTIVLYEWDFDDGSPEVSGQSPSHKFSSDGTFHVLLTVTDNFGSKNTGSLVIKVSESKVYFSSDRTGNAEIFVMDLNGGNQSEVTSNVNRDIFPSLVPNTRDKLAFASDRTTPPFFDIFSANTDGSLPSNLTNQTNHYSIEPSWSPDGEFLTYTTNRNGGNFEIYIAAKDGTLLSGGNPIISEAPNWALAPAWKPVFVAKTATSETHQLAYVRYNTGTTDSDLIRVQFTIDLTTTPPSITTVSTTNLLVDAANKDGSLGGPTFGIAGLPGSSRLSWKSDGTRVAFTRQVAPGNLDVFTIASDGTSLKNVNAECFSGNASQAGTNEFDPYWIENNDIAFVSDRTGSDQVFKVDCSAGTGLVTQLTTLGTENVHPAGQK